MRRWYKLIGQQSGISVMELVVGLLVMGVLAFGASMATIQILQQARTGLVSAEGVRETTNTIRNYIHGTGEYSGSGAPIVREQAGAPLASMWDYAIVALNGNVTMVGNAETKSVPSSPAEADVYANGNISMTGNATIRGDGAATGTISKTGNADITGTETEHCTPLNFAAINTSAYLTQSETGIPDINALKAQADNPAKKKTGSYEAVNGDVLGTNGNKYSWITGDLTIKNNNTVTLNGILHVVGKVTVDGNEKFKGTGTIISDSTDVSKAIFVSGNGELKFQGGDMQIIAIAGGIKADGNAVVAAKIYAPVGNIDFSSNGNAMTLGPMHSTKSLTISGNSQVVMGGTLYFDGSISMTGNSGLQGTGTIVSVGNIKITGNGSSQPSGTPPLLISTNGSIELAGNGWLSAVAYAPYDVVKLSGNGSVYGSVVGESVKFTGNATVVYPVTLRDW